MCSMRQMKMIQTGNNVNINHSLFDFFLNAGPVVKLVMLILLLASIISWTFIFQRWSSLKRTRKNIRLFEKEFWSGIDLSSYYNKISQSPNLLGLESIFVAGFREFNRLRKFHHVESEVMMQSVRGAMIAEQNKLTEELESHLPFLATVGSTSPYVGLFGTVWGIMTAFTALGQVQQATIAMVAPGISEALIATAMGLFAAIPAVIAYNRFTHRVNEILNRFDAFEEDFVRILYHQLHIAKEPK
jgi:biopolymer transport protein TolQ